MLHNADGGGGVSDFPEKSVTKVCDGLCACVEDGRSKSSSDKIGGFFSNFRHRFD